MHSVKQAQSALIVAVATTLLFSCFAASARALVAAGDSVLTDWHWRWDVIPVLVIFGTFYLHG